MRIFSEFSPERIAGKNDWGFGGEGILPARSGAFPARIPALRRGRRFFVAVTKSRRAAATLKPLTFFDFCSQM